MAYDAQQLLAMTQTQLDELFRSAPSGEIPNGRSEGTAIIAPGTRLASTMARISRLAWQGKVFDTRTGLLKNRIFGFGMQAIVARVYKDASWLDERECIVLDYSHTSLLARAIRDEIRLIGPNLYLGKVYWGRKRLIDFCLQF
jgi:hypothetical protein